MSLTRKVLIPVALALGVLALSSLFFGKETPAHAQAEGSLTPGRSREANCELIRLSLTAVNTMPVPAACRGSDFGLCKLVLYTNSNMGAFANGYSWEVYYRQWDDTNNWIGGPNITFGGVSFSDGHGTNGDGISKGVFLGHTFSDGGYIRIMDDGATENDPGL